MYYIIKSVGKALKEKHKILGLNRNILHIPEGFKYKIDVEAGKFSI